MFKLLKARTWVGTGAMLLSGLGVGCSHCHDHCSTCSTATVMAVPAKPQTGMVIAAKPSALPIGTLPPVVHEEFIVPAKPEIVVVEKPHIDEESLHAVTAKTDNMGRRSFPDITSRAGMDRAPDYTWLTGELHYNAQKDQWRLRYASIDEEDRYGGSVTLDGCQRQMKDMHTGMMVRVHGSMADTDSREPSPVYRIRDVSPMGQ